MRSFAYVNGVCPVGAGVAAVGGKWKIAILWSLRNGTVRFNDLHRMLPKSLSQSVLTKQLRELENDGLISRKVYPEIPPKVEYALTQAGITFLPVIVALGEWSERNLLTGECKPRSKALS